MCALLKVASTFQLSRNTAKLRLGMNYRHAFHVGNHADVLKHVALIFCLEALQRKPTAFAALDTHAGAGLYDLGSEQAQRSPEWRGGIGALWGANDAPTPVARYLEAIAAANPREHVAYYPGSPVLIAQGLRENDEAHCCELHPEEYARLREALATAPGMRLHRRDGWEALGALLPPAQKRGLVLIDPPYEAANELPRAAAALKSALKRFGHGMFLWWRPLKSESALAAADAEIASTAPRESLRADFWIDAPQPEGRLNGSSLLIVNPPFGLEAALRESLAYLATKLATGASGWRIAGHGTAAGNSHAEE
jgi:23S rRNA (adenine2030-N6)-methyltransferase